MRPFLQRLRAGMEERLDGKAEQEAEHIVYGRLTDFTQLSSAASKESQEQWNIKVPKTEKNAGAGSVRVRKSQIEGAEPNYFLTTKVKGKEGVSMEVTLPCTEDYFTMFRFLSDSGMVKDRYRYPIQGTDLVWEVDVFKKPDGSYHDWVKMDLEVKDLQEAIPDLPIQFAEVIMPDDLKGEDQEKNNAILDTLYASVFNTPNMFVSGEIKKDQQSDDQATANPAATPETADDVDSSSTAPEVVDPIQSDDQGSDNQDASNSEEQPAPDGGTDVPQNVAPDQAAKLGTESFFVRFR